MSFSKSKLESAIVTMDACNSEKLSDLNIEPPDDIEKIFLTGFSQHIQQNLPTRHQSRLNGVLVMPMREETNTWIPNRFPLGTES